MIPVYRWVKNFFGFSRAQTNAFILLLPLMGVAIFSEPVYRRWISHHSDDFSADQAKLDSLIALLEVKRKGQQPIDSSFKGNTIKPVLFVFDPNHATPEELQSLGFTKSLSTRIAHYREKGGKFRVKDDLLKIYGMDSAFYLHVYPFISLPEKSRKEERIARHAVSKVKETVVVRFNLNEADTAQLKKIYGIGEKLSLRIVRYRDGLGGFVSTSQLEEVYGLDTVVVKRLLKVSFIAEDFQPRRINVNTADEKELSAHPYLPKNAANAIVAYRFQHGEFKSLSDLEKIQSVGAKTFQKIAPYLKLND